jgi:hypothetical protein
MAELEVTPPTESVTGALPGEIPAGSVTFTWRNPLVKSGASPQ